MNLNMEVIKQAPKALVTKAKPVANHICRKVGPKAPEILLGAGIVAVGAGCTLACVRTAKKVPGIRDDIQLELADIESDYSPGDKEYRPLCAKAYLHQAGRFAEVYAVPVGVIGLGIGMIIMSHNIQHNRIVAITAGYNTLLASFNEYRSRVIEREGQYQDQAYLHGEQDVTIVEEKTSKNGKVTQKEKTVKALGSGDGEDLYHRTFDMKSSAMWTKDLDYNLAYLTAQQRIFNQKLDAYGYVFLDEVYEALGFSLDGYSNAKIVGWCKGLGDDYVDFGIYDNPNIEDSFAGGYGEAIYLNFNCDGVIVDRI